MSSGLGALLLLAACFTAGGARGLEAPGQPGSLAGQLLVAAPEMRDPRFVQTVIYMVKHDASGAMGLIVNRRLGDAPLADLVTRLGLDAAGVSGAIRVHYGGPVQPQRGFVLHGPDYAGDSTEAVDARFSVTYEPGILRAIGLGQGPRQALFALGYAGWGPGQLEDEIARGAWISVPADPGIVFDDSYADKWDRAMALRRIRL
jgi:putative transcriptional regulator